MQKPFGRQKLLAFNVAGAFAVASQPVEKNSAQGQFEDERLDRKRKARTRFLLQLCSRHQKEEKEKKMIFPVYLFFIVMNFYRGGEREEKRKTNKRRARRKMGKCVE